MWDPLEEEAQASSAPHSSYFSKSNLTFSLPISYPVSTSSLHVPFSTPHLLPLGTPGEESERKRRDKGSSQQKPRGPDAPVGPRRCLEWGMR